jgi:hypothetical protein
MTTEERFQRIEGILDRVVETQLQVDSTMLTLTESHIKLAQEMRALELQWQAYLTTIRP